MKLILLLTIIILVFCFEMFGQDCPTIKVIPPSNLPPENGAMLFSVSILGKVDTSKLEYKWSVSQGSILDGQGTTAITVLRDKKLEGGVIATIEIRGLPIVCKTQFSEETFLPPKPVCRCVIDEYEKISWFDERIRLESLIFELKADPNAKGYIILSYNNELEKKLLINRQKKILKYFESHGIASCRVLLKVENRGGYFTKFSVVPEGADLPEI